MSNKLQLRFALASAVSFSLFASLGSSETNSSVTSVADKLRQIEVIEVTSKKEIADEDAVSNDPEIEKILELVDSVEQLKEEIHKLTDSVEPSSEDDAHTKVDHEDKESNSSKDSEINDSDTPNED